MALSIAPLARLKPDTAVAPVVEKTWPAFPSIRGSALMISTAASERGISCARLFLVREGGSVQVLAARSISLQRIDATSSRRAPVRSKSWQIGPKGQPIDTKDCQASLISSSLKTRSRVLSEERALTPAQGEILISLPPSRDMAQLQSFRNTANVRFEVRGARSAISLSSAWTSASLISLRRFLPN